MSSIENNRGRIRKPIAPEVVKYINDPVAKSDYETSYAHVLMLEKQGIISKDVCQKILKATREIEANPVAPDFTKDSGIEDLYTTLERRLIKMVGLDVGGQQHTARSRNDLGATVVRMDTRDYYLKICELFNKFRATAIAVARDNVDAVMSGYTHMQPSEPVTLRPLALCCPQWIGTGLPSLCRGLGFDEYLPARWLLHGFYVLPD